MIKYVAIAFLNSGELHVPDNALGRKVYDTRAAAMSALNTCTCSNKFIVTVDDNNTPVPPPAGLVEKIT